MFNLAFLANATQTTPGFKEGIPASGVYDLDLLTQGNWYITLFVKILLPIILMLIFSIIVGFERQNMGKAAGLTSHTFVGLGSVCISIVQRFMWEFAIMNHQNPIQGQRIVAQVVTGIGFLGAGVIMKDKFSIKGLTTAATIWVTAILGIIFGLGYLITGSILALLIIAFIITRDLKRGINPFEKVKDKEKDKKTVVDSKLTDKKETYICKLNEENKLECLPSKKTTTQDNSKTDNKIDEVKK